MYLTSIELINHPCMSFYSLRSITIVGVVSFISMADFRCSCERFSWMYRWNFSLSHIRRGLWCSTSTSITTSFSFGMFYRTKSKSNIIINDSSSGNGSFLDICTSKQSECIRDSTSLILFISHDWISSSISWNKCNISNASLSTTPTTCRFLISLTISFNLVNLFLIEAFRTSFVFIFDWVIIRKHWNSVAVLHRWYFYRVRRE